MKILGIGVDIIQNSRIKKAIKNKSFGFIDVSKKINAQLMIGPAKGPLPTSSIPITFWLKYCSILKSGKLFFF